MRWYTGIDWSGDSRPMRGGTPPPAMYVQAPPARRGTNGLAVASMILGILWLCSLGSLLAVIMGHIALSQIKSNNAAGIPQDGTGFAVAGLILGYIGVGILVFYVVIFVIAFGTTDTSTASAAM